MKHKACQGLTTCLGCRGQPSSAHTLCLIDLDHPFSAWDSVSPSGCKGPELDNLEVVYLMF